MGKNTKKERKDGEEKSQHSAATVCDQTNIVALLFALPEDANRAIELKNGSTVGGRRITVKQATHRPSLKERRTKAAQGVSLPDSSQAESDDKKDSLVPETVTETETDKQVPPPEKKIEKPLERKKPTKPAKLLVDLADKETCSDKQRVARTVIFGGLVNAEMAEAVHSRVKKIGTVCSVRYPLPKEELQQNGLTQDGCRAEASAVLFTSVKSACAAVATLHQTEIKGNLIWARQLGGEGSKAQKWKLIIRNLPFKAKPSEIKEVFSAVGFVWDVFVPKNIETGLPKGFAFVKFTCKRDAENAIQKFNGHMFSKRPIAVDWAVPKNLYNGAADAATAPEDGEKDGSDGDSDNSSVDLEEVDDAVESHQSSGDDTDNDEEDGSNKPSESDALVKDAETDVNFEEEADVARKVLKNLLGSSKVTIASQGGETEESDINILEDSSTKPVVESSGVSEPLKSSKTKEAAPKETQENDDFKRTVFISNIPFDVSKEEVTQRFTAFGQVESLFLVLHPVTKRPKGTAFLKFKTADASDAAISAASSASGVGVLLKGRQLSVMRAVDKKSAKDIGLEKTKEKNIDHRNLYLAKEGQILEGTPAAEGVSAEDMDRRRRLHENKMKKLQSPNFHVSKTRIVIYNLPKSMDEKQLQKLLVDAVTSRATKQKPTIRQIKFLQNEKKGKVDTKNYSRGVAFVEFTEPDHALVALRVLNNNPETFGPQHRPVIEFAVDNVQKLKVHKANQQQQRNRYNESREQRENGEAQGEDNHPGNDLKRRTRDGDNTGSVEENANGYKKRKPMHPREQRREESKPEEKSSLSVKEDGGNKRPARTQGNTKEPASNQKGQWKKRQQEASEKPDEKEISKDVSDAPRKRKFEEVRGGENVNGQRKRKNQNEKKKKQGGPPEVVDKLDMLIEQYRSKFTQSSAKTGPQKQSSGQVISSIYLLLVVFVSVSVCETQHEDDILIRQVVNGSESEPTVMSWEDHFTLFKRRYGKVYNSLEEHQHRFWIFRSNFMRATRHQRMDPFARHGVTQFSDLTHSEFRRKHLGLKARIRFHSTLNKPRFSIQRIFLGACGSSWSFSTTGALEGAHFLATGKLVSLSEQQLVDCDHQCDPEVEGLCDSGCNGGLMNIASEYTFETGGLMREEDYPYTGTTDGDGICKLDKSKIVASVFNFSVVSSNEDQIAANLVKNGPLAVAINSAYMKTYVGGVLCPYMCSRSLNHGVLLVGYGSEGSRFKEKPYWIIKNSWGETWGESGFFKLCKGRNICGFGSLVSTV
ncbi:hypothetical protein IGI04_038326 [Brassica rapa subsp. trilocularis]|uniref:RRM domain-containing protein n=1 Tax=Brassica rapa subsp. trilocularis TaxID=1813537 RepID=A0ABQ7LNT9_BRACM|nr:hypothetical protein IGI04_038326 [Brassica rapa subsp. trilocularis]